MPKNSRILPDTYSSRYISVSVFLSFFVCLFPYSPGLYPLHIIMQQGHYELRIEMADWEGETAYATYRGLTIGNSTENFKLTVGRYKGNAG